ncbi:hypothetical protein ACFSTI_25070 [Rhizorhabdus histidinilytica]|uniref:Uncharacterized protein n=1 Tax=Rhizorhabdus histidinilytica TaxID=439228 RepID=A0A1T5A8I8_9SPHN|nr:hypothetical protein [Rhizorhabdus histidinilytica]SKB31037.1 hypothetical protein SAMN06295920_101684 [Rhizorhabdus histidinilytica]
MTDTLTACARAMEERAVSWSRDYPGLALPEECPYDILARACLTALAENVSREMRQSGWDETPCNWSGTADDLDPIFTAMIRAAVGEK